MNILGVEEGEESVPCRVELVVSCLKKDRSVWGGQDGLPKEIPSFFSISCCGLLEKNMFSSFEGFDGPFVV
jgi:hypothetical protein